MTVLAFMFRLLKPCGIASVLVAVVATGALGADTAPAAETPGPRWEPVFYGIWEGRPALLYNDTIAYAKLAFGDLDGDGDPDLLLGEFDGRIDRFDNAGSADDPRWRLVQQGITALVPRPGAGGGQALTATIQVGRLAAPALVDIDRDGDLDLFVGAEDGRLRYFRNIGNAALPTFQLVQEDVLGRSFGKALAPVFVDADGNRTADLVLGNAAGEVFFLPNTGSLQNARFCAELPAPAALPGEAPPCRPVPRRIAAVAPESHAVPALADWENDRAPDLFVGKSDGTLDFYHNEGTAFAPTWRLAMARFVAIDNGGYAAPTFLDANADGRPDLLIGNSTSTVTLYTNKGTNDPNDVWQVTRNVLGVRRFGAGLRRASLASGDLDGDGDPDLLVGGGAGALRRVENVGTANRPAWRMHTANVLGDVERERIAPALGDLDGDGDLDLLVGGSDGRLWFFRNGGDAQTARFGLETSAFGAVDVGDDSVPALFDIDGDGDLDLLVGNGRGNVIYYRNSGSAALPEYELASTRFGGFAVSGGAAPAVIDWQGDELPDLVVGGQDGQLMVLLNPGKDAADDATWEKAATNWAPFAVRGYSAPHFVDLNGDGLPDMLIGDGDGNVRLWMNGGMPAGAAPPAGEEKPAQGGGESAAVPTPEAAATPEPVFPVQPAAPETPAAAAPNVLGSMLDQPLVEGPLQPAFTLASDHYADIRFSGRLAPAFGDVDGDGDQDLVVAGGAGEIVYYRNDGTAAQPAWTRAAEHLAGDLAVRNPSPLLADLDGDGALELLLGTDDGHVLLFRNTAGAGNPPQFEREQIALANINVGRNAAPAVGPLDDKGVPQLLVGSFTGHLWSFLRDGGAQSLNFRLGNRRYAGIDVGISATPYFGDIDRDGEMDLLIGSDQGRVRVFKRTGEGAGRWQLDEGLLAELPVPFGTTPRLVDIDDDGDVDLFLGSEKGTLYFFRNDAVP